MNFLNLGAQGGEAVRWSAWLGGMASLHVIGWLCIGVVLITVWFPFQCRVLTLQALLLVNKVEEARHASLSRLEVESQIFVLSCEVTYLRLKRRYLLLKRISVHKFVEGALPPNRDSTAVCG